MKVFISWSGARSQAAAMLLREWLQDVLQYCQPFVSSEDISKGRRWLPEIVGELQDAKFGIICLTRANMSAPWVLFEAGALGAKYSEGRVSCLLVGLSATDVAAPLGQFQNTPNSSEEVWKLVASINGSAGEQALSEERLRRTFETYWPRLEKGLKEIEASKAYGDMQAQTETKRDPASIADETLETVRSIHRLFTEFQADRSRAEAELAAAYQRLVGAGTVTFSSNAGAPGPNWTRVPGMLGGAVPGGGGGGLGVLGGGLGGLGGPGLLGGALGNQEASGLARGLLDTSTLKPEEKKK